MEKIASTKNSNATLSPIQSSNTVSIVLMNGRISRSELKGHAEIAW